MKSTPSSRCFLDAGEDLVDGHVDHRLVLAHHRVDGRLVEGDAADADVGLADDGGADLVDGTAGGEVHDGVGAGGHRHPGLLQLLVDAGVVLARADVGVDLGAQTQADGQRDAGFAPHVVADDGGARGDALAQQFGVDSLGGRGLSHRVGNDALAGKFELGHRRNLNFEL